jgi:hypothetical protein
MYDSVWAYALVLAVCAVLCVRCFFQDSITRDSLSVLAAANLVLCALCFCAWGVSIMFVCVSLTAVMVLLINLRCISRYTARLKHGRFSGGFVFASLLMLPLIAVFTFLLVYFRPVRFNAADSGVVEEKTLLTGSFRSGLTQRDIFFQPVNAAIATFTPQDSRDSALPLVLFVCDLRASVSDYVPFLALLAKEGYEVKAAEFFTSDNRRFNSILDARLVRKFAARIFSLAGSADAVLQGSFTLREYEALISLYGVEASRQGRNVYLVSDSNPAVLARAAAFLQPAGVLSVMPGPRPGYGCIEQTDPLLARYFGAERDTELASPREAVTQWKTRF